MSIHEKLATEAVIDAEGFRANVGIIVSRPDGRLLWARRVGRAGWQFPQGGIQPREEPEAALYRELQEEIGLGADDVDLLGRTRSWLRYRLPVRYQRPASLPLCIGQKQIWFLLRFEGAETTVRFDLSPSPEFDDWRWVDYWYPVNEVIFFKRRVYREALTELAPLLFPDGAPPAPPARRRPRRRNRRH